MSSLIIPVRQETESRHHINGKMSTAGRQPPPRFTKISGPSLSASIAFPRPDRRPIFIGDLPTLRLLSASESRIRMISFHNRFRYGFFLKCMGCQHDNSNTKIKIPPWCVILCPILYIYTDWELLVDGPRFIVLKYCLCMRTCWQQLVNFIFIFRRSKYPTRLVRRHYLLWEIPC